MKNPIRDLRAWVRKKNMEYLYQQMVMEVRKRNVCPICGSGMPQVAKIFMSVHQDPAVWMAALACTNPSCNTHWSAPQPTLILPDR